MNNSDPYGKEPSRGRHVHSDRRAEISLERRSLAVSSREASSLPPPLMTVEELAALLHTSKGAVYARHARGGIPGGLRLGRTLRFDPRIIAQWLSANSASAGGRS
ncbi:helix-turn-helix transcriptional regulator [Nannocystis exedens]|uniref:helix-turn-helix transcriptional regulator n=1 Tax=Nannocystis exedens TaxID=54 RepID=UPI001FE4F96B|nr:helix-turn-helix domain-containing protein [Nannocystis exedens]